MVFDWRRKKQVVLYSMDRNADSTVRMALAATRGLRTRLVFTLNKAVIAGTMISAKQRPPAHILNADRILRRELGEEETYYFVTVVSDVPDKYGDAATWFEKEYLPATGIDVGADPFDHAALSREYTVGPHKLLLLSAHAPVVEQERILSAFVGKPVARIQTKNILHTAMHWNRSSAISRPLEYLRSAPSHDARSEKLMQTLDAQYRLLHAPYPFTHESMPAFTPKARTILYNPHQSLPFHTSGYATRTHGINHALSKKNWDMHIVTRAGYPLDTRIEPNGLSSHTIDGVPYRYDNSEGHGQWDLPLDAYIDHAANYLVQQARDIHPSLIHTASNYLCGLAGVEAARRLDLPSVYEMRGLWHITRWSKDPAYAQTDKFALAQKMELEAAAAADRVIAITGALKEWLVERGIDEGKISLAPNAVDLSQFTVREPDLAFAQETGCAGKIVLGYIGSFVQYEGLDLLLHAVAMLPDEMRAQLRLLWIGDGAVLQDLLRMASELGIAENVISLGRRPFEDVPRAYSIVDISAFPRKGQPICEIVSPLKPFEAMAMKKAIIVSSVRPLREIVSHGVTGLIHDKDNAASLSEQLARFIADESLRKSCGANARAWIEKTRQWDIIAEGISEVYRELI